MREIEFRGITVDDNKMVFCSDFVIRDFIEDSFVLMSYLNRKIIGNKFENPELLENKGGKKSI